MEGDADNVQSRPRSPPSPEIDARENGCDLRDLKKELAIGNACIESDIAALKALAESEGGFLTDDLRRRAWPILLGYTPDTANGHDSPLPWQKLPRHDDEEQVQLDVNRAFIYYPDNLSESELAERKSELSDLIVEVLRRHPFLCYFQGYHDICQVFLLILEPAIRAPLVARLSLLRIRDFMLPTLAPTIAQLRLLPDILHAADPNLRGHLDDIEPFYALSGTLTMYAHNIEGYKDIARLFDVLLAREPVFSIYLFAQIVLSRRQELLETAAEDPSMLHLILSKVPRNLDLESLVSDAITLFERHPPTTLPFWRRISSSSCLKTAGSVHTNATQSQEDGRRFFDMQLRELRRAEKWDEFIKGAWVHRRSASAIGIAVLVGIAAVYLRKHPTPMSYLTNVLWLWPGRGA